MGREVYCPINLPPVCKPMDRFKVECVVVCSGYHDFLRCTLPNNKHFFDKMVVVTSPEDKQTQKLCEFYHVQCVISERLVSGEQKFCKGEAVNDGLAKLDKDGWVVHLDADVWLPPQTRIILERASLDKKMIYGIDRFNARGYDLWAKFLRKPELQHEAQAYVHVHNSLFKVGTRYVHEGLGGYVPLGFFQMWNPRVSGKDKYPESGTSAGATDVLFAALWPRCERGFIPELLCYHLESIDAEFAINWWGRKSAPFEPLPLWEKIKIYWRKLWN